MIRSVMRQRGVASLEDLIRQAGELGVRIHVCEMSMNVMGLRPEELIAYPGLDIVGVGSFIKMVREAKQVISSSQSRQAHPQRQSRRHPESVSHFLPGWARSPRLPSRFLASPP